jgi:hypothetical protein
MMSNTTDQAIAEFLAKGGQIQKIERGVSGNPGGNTYSAWGSRKKAVVAAPAINVEEDEDINSTSVEGWSNDS